jgi:hypothetical protein
MVGVNVRTATARRFAGPIKASAVSVWRSFRLNQYNKKAALLGGL